MGSKASFIAAALVAVLGVLLLAGGPGSAAPGATERVSVDSTGVQGNRWSWEPAISADGRYVAFESDASNLAPGDTNGVPDVFVHDRVTGLTERVSVPSGGTQANGASLFPAITGDGRYVAFQSYATNLVPGDTNDAVDVFVHDRVTGATERVSVASNGDQADNDSLTQVISGDGRYVAFQSYATNLVPGDTNGAYDVFVHDRLTGATERVSVDSNAGQGNRGSFWPAISGGARYVAFWSGATNLVPGDTNGWADVFVHDRETGTTERVSVATDGTQGNNESLGAAVSADGRYVVFSSYADNLVPGDSNRVQDVFVHDRVTGTTERVSVASGGSQADDESFDQAVSADGRYIAFRSYASNLVPGDTNGWADVFVHDRQANATERISVADVGAQGNSESRFPRISENGRYVAFESFASNLVPGDTNGYLDVFVRDRGPTAGSTYTPTRTLTPTPAVSPTPTPTLTPTPTATPGGVKGDMDCDGDVDAVDALRILRYVAGLDLNLPAGCPPIGPAGLDAKGDMDCDGDVDAVDALRILRSVAGLDPNLPAGCPPMGSVAG